MKKLPIENVTGQPANLVSASVGILALPLVGSLHGPDEWIDIESMGLYFRIREEFVRGKLVQS